MEGVNGVVLKEHVDPARKEYDIARQWMLAEVNAAIEGLVRAGAKEVVVNDSHNAMANIAVDRLHPAASLVTGPSKPFSMMQDMDDSFDAALFVGYHAKFGTPLAVHDHIFSYSILKSVRINDYSVGEFGLNAGLAGYFGVPVIMVTGDQAIAAEAKSLIPEIETVVVKEGRGRYAAACRPFQQSIAMIGEAAQRALQNLTDKQPFRLNAAPTLAITFQKAELADKVSLVPHVSRTDAFTILYKAKDFRDLYRMFLVLYRLATA